MKIRVGNKLKSYWTGEWWKHGRHLKNLGNRRWRQFNKQLCKKELKFKNEE